jgi:hypothetical protein
MYNTTATSLGLSNLGRDDAKDFAYCGGGFQSSSGTKEQRQHEELRHSRQKTTLSSERWAYYRQRFNLWKQSFPKIFNSTISTILTSSPYLVAGQ